MQNQDICGLHILPYCLIPHIDHVALSEPVHVPAVHVPALSEPVHVPAILKEESAMSCVLNK